MGPVAQGGDELPTKADSEARAPRAMQRIGGWGKGSAQSESGEGVDDSLTRGEARDSRSNLLPGPTWREESRTSRGSGGLAMARTATAKFECSDWGESFESYKLGPNVSCI